MNSCWTIANYGAHLLLTRLILLKKSEGVKLTRKSIISSAKTTCPHSGNGIALPNWKKSIVNEIEKRLKEDHGIRPSTIDGFPGSQWIVLDYLQVVVHVFHRDKRSFYSLEDLWGDALRLDWEAAVTAR